MRAPILSLVLMVGFGAMVATERGRAQVPEEEIRKLQEDAARPKPAMPPEGTKRRDDIDLLSLVAKGGIFMIPIGVASLVALTFIVDRSLGLRRGRLMPAALKKNLVSMIRAGDAADPRDMYRLCQGDSSALGEIASTVVARAGRPQIEIHEVAAEATQRQVDRAYAHVRWLNLVAGIAPLLGLLGTVWGLIQAFHDTTQLTAGQNRADFLAVGIYEALVTTLAGLVVAIPAAVASHYFEGKITRMFGQIEALISDLVKSLERYEGRTRFDVIGRELAPRDVNPRT